MKKISNRSKRSLNNSIAKLFARPKQNARKIVLRPEGNVYHLSEIRDSIFAQYFECSLNLPITWFGSGAIPKSSVQFGSYTYQTQLIKVNRVLDRSEVPLEFVRFIVFHEILHHFHPPKRGKRGRWDIHHQEFRAEERKFREYEAAKKFLKNWRETHFSGRNT